MFHTASCGADHLLVCVVGAASKSVAESLFTCAMTAATVTAFTVWGISPGVVGSATTVSLFCKSYLESSYCSLRMMILDWNGGETNKMEPGKEKNCQASMHVDFMHNNYYDTYIYSCSMSSFSSLIILSLSSCQMLISELLKGARG